VKRTSGKSPRKSRPRRRLGRLVAWVVAFGVAIVVCVAVILWFSRAGNAALWWSLGIGVGLLAVVRILPPLRVARAFSLRLVAMLVPAFLAVVAHANITAVWASRGRLFDDPARLPPTRAAVVFGTASRINGRENLYFRYRIDAAVEVWQSGKVDTFIVSGDNSTLYYNEPLEMRRALIARGVPDDRIVSDDSGLRTLDSVVRAKEVFGADPVLFISQRFQNERAIYLAKANGIEAYGFNARDVGTQAGMKTRIREIGARVKMWIDVRFLDTRPSHLGDPVALPE